LSEQDISTDELPLITSWHTKGYLKKDNDVYRFHSKYRAGTVGLIQNQNAYLHVIGENIKDLFLSKDNLLNAIEGDLVISKRLLGYRGEPSAKVVEIVGKEQTYSVGYIVQKDTHRSLVDLKTNHPVGVEITLDELNSYELGDLFKIDNLENKILQKLGNISDPKVDEAIVLAQFNKHDEFEDDVLELTKEFKEVDISKYPQRADLRELDFCTIDPVTAKDFDDAICWDEKNYTLYVAIADVSEYVKPFGALDNEAIYRSFSIYLPHRSIPMLPRALSETLCSLQPHKDRLAYVFEIKLDSTTLEVANSKVYEAVIFSKRRFNYDEIDSFFQGDFKVANSEEQRVLDSLKKLKKVTDALKIKRLKKGFDFRSDEIEMQLDENTDLISTSVAKETPSHSLIEDCMLLANKEAASMYERGVFRVHESPSQSKLQTLYAELMGVGINVEIKDSVKETITAIQAQAKEIGLESEVDSLIIRSQMQAKYTPINLGHFGLGFERYTHFTSPIRRYSDLIVHRLLKAIAKDDTKEGSYVLRNIESLCSVISQKEREASSVEFEYMARKYTRWASQNLNKEFKAKVIATQSDIKVELKDEIEGAKIAILNAPNDITLFEDVTIKIEKADIAQAKIFATIVEKTDV